jgi:hypothetical protein
MAATNGQFNFSERTAGAIHCTIDFDFDEHAAYTQHYTWPFITSIDVER